MAAQELKRPGIRKIAVFLRPELENLRRFFAAVILTVLASSAISYALPWMQRHLIDALSCRADGGTIALLIAGVTLLFGGEKLLQVLRNYFLKVLYNSGTMSLKRRMLKTMLGVSGGSVEELGGDYVALRLMQDIERFGQFYFLQFSTIFSCILRCAGGWICLAVFADWRVAAAMLPMLGIFAWMVLYFRRRQFALALEVSERRTLSSRSLHETLRNLASVKQHSAQRSSSRHFGKTLHNLFRLQQERFRLDGIFQVLLVLLPGICLLGALCWGIRNYLDGAMTLGAIWMILSYLRFLFEPLQRLCSMMLEMQQSEAAGARLMELQHLTGEANCGTRVPESLLGDIEFSGVSFAYGNGGKTIMQNWNCCIPGRAKCAVTGASGCGKSTMAALLMQLYVPSAGEIRIGGVPVQEYRLDEYRKKIRYIGQKTDLFAGTVRENLTRHFVISPGDGELWDALDAAGAGDLVRSLPDQLESPVWEEGNNFSMGERIRLMLARELLRESDILIFDETTANLDSGSETKILDVILKRFERRTVLFISHRRSTVERFPERLDWERTGEKKDV